MEQLVRNIVLITRKKDSRRVIILSSAALFVLLLIVQSGHVSDATGGRLLIVAILGSLLAGINLSLAYLHTVNQEQLSLFGFDHSFRSYSELLKRGSEMYGIALFSVILSFAGFSAMLSSLPNEAEQVGYVGLIFLLMATLVLSRRLKKAGV